MNGRIQTPCQCSSRHTASTHCNGPACRDVRPPRCAHGCALYVTKKLNGGREQNLIRINTSTYIRTLYRLHAPACRNDYGACNCSLRGTSTPRTVVTRTRACAAAGTIAATSQCPLALVSSTSLTLCTRFSDHAQLRDKYPDTHETGSELTCDCGVDSDDILSRHLCSPVHFQLH